MPSANQRESGPESRRPSPRRDSSPVDTASDVHPPTPQDIVTGGTKPAQVSNTSLKSAAKVSQDFKLDDEDLLDLLSELSEPMVSKSKPIPKLPTRVRQPILSGVEQSLGPNDKNVPGPLPENELSKQAHGASRASVYRPALLRLKRATGGGPSSGVTGASETAPSSGEPGVQPVVTGGGVPIPNPAIPGEKEEVVHEYEVRQTPKLEVIELTSKSTRASSTYSTATYDYSHPTSMSLPPPTVVHDTNVVHAPIRAAATSFTSPPTSPPRVGKGKRRRRSTDSPRTTAPLFADSGPGGSHVNAANPPAIIEHIDAKAVDLSLLHGKVVVPKPVVVLGSGAFGLVLSAKSISKPSRLLAVKFIPRAARGTTDYDDQKIATHREVEIAKLLNEERKVEGLSVRGHRNVAEFVDFLEGGAGSFIIFGFVGNRNLHWSIHCGPGRLDEPQAKMVLREFGQAEVFFQKSGIVHCDLKPANGVLTHSIEDPNCRIVVVDFGCCRREVDTKATGAFNGTEAYSAPEIHRPSLWSGNKTVIGYDHQVDVWAIGCILFEGLTAQPPKWNAENPKPKFQKLSKRISESGVALMKRLLTRDPHARISITEALEARWEEREPDHFGFTIRAPAAKQRKK